MRFQLLPGSNRSWQIAPFQRGLVNRRGRAHIFSPSLLRAETGCCSPGECAHASPHSSAVRPSIRARTVLQTHPPGHPTAGYVMWLPRTFANDVSEWGCVRVGLMMCATAQPRTFNAPAIGDRWQRQGTASAHIIAICSTPAAWISVSRPAANSGVCMYAANPRKEELCHPVLLES
jgi:hypothetical protein